MEFQSVEGIGKKAQALKDSNFCQIILTYMYLGDCEDTGTKTQVRTAANSALKHIFLS
jgi:hypothetical protein